VLPPPPSVSRIRQTTEPRKTSIWVTITGSNFYGQITMTCNGSKFTTVDSVSPTKIRVFVFTGCGSGVVSVSTIAGSSGPFRVGRPPR
jgi:hypothetical protein